MADSQDKRASCEGFVSGTTLHQKRLANGNQSDYNPSPQQRLPPGDADVSGGQMVLGRGNNACMKPPSRQQLSLSVEFFVKWLVKCFWAFTNFATLVL